MARQRQARIREYRNWVLRALAQPLDINLNFSMAVVLGRIVVMLELEQHRRLWLEILIDALVIPILLWLFCQLCELMAWTRRLPTIIVTPIKLVIVGGIVAVTEHSVFAVVVGKIQFSFWAQLFGAIIITLLVFLVRSQSKSVTWRYREIGRRKEEASAQLDQLRREADTLIGQVAAEMKLTTHEAFRTHFDALQNATKLRIPESALKLVEDMREGSVRPTSHALVREIFDWERLLQPVNVRNPLLLPRQIAFGSLIRPDILLALAPLFVVGKAFAEGPEEIWPAIVYIVFQTSLWFIAHLVSKRQTLTGRLSALLLLLLSLTVPLISTLPEYLLTDLGEKDGSFWIDYVQNLQLSPVLIAGIGYYSAVLKNLGDVSRQFQVITKDQAVMKALISQRIQAMRREFGYFLHGTIQSALNAAVMRLQGSKYSDAGWREFVKNISSAERMLLEYRPTPIEIDEQLQAIEDLWSGVVDLKCEWLGASKASVEADPVLAFSLSEIWREAVSNAVRHGGARHVTITHDLDGANLLLKKATTAKPRISRSSQISA